MISLANHMMVFLLNARNVFDSRWRQLKGAKLCSFLLESHHLRSCVDIAIENCSESKIRVAVFESDLYKRVSSLLNFHPPYRRRLLSPKWNSR